MTEPWRGSLLRLGAGSVLLGGQALADVVRALEAARRVTRGDGYGPDPRWVALLGDLRAALAETAATACAGSAAVPQATEPSWSDDDLIDTREVARMLGCKPRNVRDLSARGVFDSGHLRAGRLLFARSEVLAEVLRRQEKRCA